MMGHREALKDADEYDAIKARKFYFWRRGVIHKIKKRISRRIRREVRRALANED